MIAIDELIERLETYDPAENPMQLTRALLEGAAMGLKEQRSKLEVQFNYLVQLQGQIDGMVAARRRKQAAKETQ